MSNAAIAAQIGVYLMQLGWEQRGGDYTMKLGVNRQVRCRLKGRRALFYHITGGKCAEFTSFYYAAPRAVTDAILHAQKIAASAKDELGCHGQRMAMPAAGTA